MKKVLFVLLFTVLCLGFTGSELKAQSSVAGIWTIYIDWSCDGSYTSTIVTFYSDGTMSSSGATWDQEGCWVMWQYSNGCILCGIRTGNFMMGIIIYEGRIAGCWYAIRTSTATSLSDKEASDGLGPDGE